SPLLSHSSHPTPAAALPRAPSTDRWHWPVAELERCWPAVELQLARQAALARGGAAACLPVAEFELTRPDGAGPRRSSWQAVVGPKGGPQWGRGWRCSGGARGRQRLGEVAEGQMLPVGSALVSGKVAELEH